MKASLAFKASALREDHKEVEALVSEQDSKQNKFKHCKRVFYLCGNARTFLQCFDNTYENIISKLFKGNNKDNTYILFYLKCDDPGPKGQDGWNFSYDPTDQNQIADAIEKYKKKYKQATFYSKILSTNEISDEELLLQVKDKTKYGGFLNEKLFIRGCQQLYNHEKCGDLIKAIEARKKFQFDYLIYIRPDLFFSEPCGSISDYSQNKLTLGKGPDFEGHNYDHIAIIPKKYKYDFLFGKMNLIRTNTKHHFYKSEQIYWHNTPDSYEIRPIGKHEIKR